MRKRNRYNVYDNNQLIMENVTSGEVTKALDCKTICINTYAAEQMKYKDRYTFEIVESEEMVSNDFVKEWQEMVNLFKNVIWVKTGGRRLYYQSKGVSRMKCDFEEKECNIRCQYYHTCTRSEYRKREQEEAKKDK